MNWKALLAASAAFAMTGSAVAQENGASLAAKFGALESVLDIGLSPDGRTAFYVTPLPTGGRRVVMVDLDTGDARGVTQARNPGETL
jgi:hypothetical protein